MQYFLALFGILAMLPAANCIAFGGAAPTNTSPDRVLEGLSPKPTKGPSVAELRRRQSESGPETCGWVDADLSSGLTCAEFGATCMLYTASGIGMAGCCQRGDLQSCGWATTCIDYDTYQSSAVCGAACEQDPFIRKCANPLTPYCATWTYAGDDVQDFGCVATSSSLIETIYQYGTDRSDSSTQTLLTISDDAVIFSDESSVSSATGTDTDLSFTNTDTSISDPTYVPTGGSSSRKKKKGNKVSIGMIVGIVIAALVVLFVIGAIVIFLCVKQKKKRQLANNQQAVAAAQASRPQSEFNPQMQQQQPVPQYNQPPVPPMPSQTPQPGLDGYFKPAAPPSPQPGYTQPADQKYGAQSQVNEYSVPSPISNPPTPAPAYVQPYYAAPNGGAVPPMPTQSPAPGQYQNREPTPGTHEIDAISTPQNQQAHGGQVHELGGK